MIEDLTEDMGILLSECTADPNDLYSKEDLSAIQENLGMLQKQGEFWDKRGNKDRYIYDLNNFIAWRCEFMETKEYEF